ncbi:MAG: hypothetical protein ACYTKD_23575 [Planctomycetota bacterium]
MRPLELRVRRLDPLNEPGREWKRAAFGQYPRGRVMGYSMRTDRWRYTEWRSRKSKEVTARELYDHSAHEIDRVNVASRPENAALVKKLHAMLDAGWRACAAQAAATSPRRRAARPGA